MRSSQRAFAENVNMLMERLLQPLMNEQRPELAAKGMETSKIDEILLIVKTQHQAEYLPKVRQWLKDEIKKSTQIVEQELTADSQKLKP
jgi:hypothetical protein